MWEVAVGLLSLVTGVGAARTLFDADGATPEIASSFVRYLSTSEVFKRKKKISLPPTFLSQSYPYSCSCSCSDFLGRLTADLAPHHSGWESFWSVAQWL